MHIMKTAGTTFTVQLVKHLGPDEVYPPEGPAKVFDYWAFDRLLELPPTEIDRIRVLHGHYPLFVGELIGVDRTFTILREPIDRLVSHLRQALRYDRDGRWSSIEELYDSDLGRHLIDYQVRQFSRTVDDDPLELDDRHLTTALDRLDTVDLVGFTDRFDGFVAAVHNRYGWDCRTPERLQVAPDEACIDPAFRRRLVRENELDVAFYAEALARRGDRDTLVSSER